MNKAQKQIQQVQLDSEQKTIRQLQRVYEQAKKDTERKISELSSRTDLENLQSIVYQKQYQEAIKKQLEGVLDDLQGKQFTTVADYLQESYHNGYVGVMYDLTKQGIPVIMPINQEQVVKALQTDSKISQGLYSRMGEDVQYLKRSIRAELSRGIAQGSSWNEIAGRIANGMNSPYRKALNRTILIARTEGHRIQQQSALDAQYRAKEKGADIVKQWDSTLDNKTRPHHRRLDGQIRELDEPFEVDGLKAVAPGQFGRASEDCNCRCCLLQRAKWALDEDELDELKERAEFFGLDKTDDFDDFKKKYLPAAEIEQATIAAKQNYDKIELTADDFGAVFNDKREKKITQKLTDYVNGLEGANPDTLNLYKTIGKMQNFDAYNVPFSISHGKNHAVSYRHYMATGDLADVKLIIPKLTGDNIAGQVNTTLHEDMHFLDLLYRKYPKKAGDWFSTSNKELVDTFQKTDAKMSDTVSDLFRRHDEECKKVRERVKLEYDKKISELAKSYVGEDGSVWNLPYSDYKKYEKDRKKLYTAMQDAIDYELRNVMGGGIGNLEDIYDALSKGAYRDSHKVLYGHGGSYYRSSDSQIHETVANYGALSVTRPDLIEMLRQDKPELVAALEKNIQKMLEKAGGTK